MILDHFDSITIENGSPMYNATTIGDINDPTTITAWFTLPSHGIDP